MVTGRRCVWPAYAQREGVQGEAFGRAGDYWLPGGREEMRCGPLRVCFYRGRGYDRAAGHSIKEIRKDFFLISTLHSSLSTLHSSLSTGYTVQPGHAPPFDYLIFKLIIQHLNWTLQ